MKIVKLKEVVTEEIELKVGTYYFEDENIVSHKFTLSEPEDEYSDYTLEILQGFSNVTGIRIKEGGAWDEEDLPYAFKQFILGVAGKEITKEEYDKERQEILDKLCK